MTVVTQAMLLSYLLSFEVTTDEASSMIREETGLVGRIM
jgi:hypothetical protein